jgi:hypothetical protein
LSNLLHYSSFVIDFTYAAFTAKVMGFKATESMITTKVAAIIAYSAMIMVIAIKEQCFVKVSLSIIGLTSQGSAYLLFWEGFCCYYLTSLSTFSTNFTLLSFKTWSWGRLMGH